MTQYYEEVISAARCVSAIKHEGTTWATGAYLPLLLSRLPDIDADLGRTWALARTQASLVEPAGGLRRWLHMVIWNQDAHGELRGNPRHVVDDLLPVCIPLKGKPPKRAMNLLRLTILDLRWQHGLSGEDLAATFIKHLVNAKDSTETLERSMLVSFLKCSSTTQFRAFARTLAWMTRQSAAQAEAFASSRRELKNIQEQKSRLSTDVAELRTQVADLVKKLKATNTQTSNLERQLQESTDSASLRVHDLSGQVSGTLTGRIAPLLQQATDALEMSQPRVRAAREFIDTAQDGIGELRRWLTAESTSERPTA